MGIPSVFISHSTDPSSADPYLDAIADALKKGGRHRVLLDREDLRVSDDWNFRIVNWLASCHAAVVIFSPRALESHYVKFEVANLFARWQRTGRAGDGDGFPFCGVLPAGMSAERLRSGYYGSVRIPDAQLLSAASPEHAAAEIDRRLEPLRQRQALPRTPIDRLRARVELLVGRLNPRQIEPALSKLGREASANPDSDIKELADALLCSTLGEVLKGLKEMRPTPDRSFPRELFDLIAPSWVGPEAALALHTRLVEARERAIHVTLNAEYPNFTPAMYLQRAVGSDLASSGKVLDLTTATTRSGITAAALAHDIRSALLKCLEEDVDPNSPEAEATLREALRFQQEADRAIVVAIKLSPARLVTLRSMDARAFPGVTFVTLSGADRDDELLLRPELLHNQEQSAFENYRRAERVVRDLTNG